jgi:hypothetical protein
MVAKQTQLWRYHKRSGAVFKKSPTQEIKKQAVTQPLWRYLSRKQGWLKNFSAFLHGLGRSDLAGWVSHPLVKHRLGTAHTPLQSFNINTTARRNARWLLRL